jgi:hypothetical protein
MNLKTPFLDSVENSGYLHNRFESNRRGKMHPNFGDISSIHQDPKNDNNQDQEVDFYSKIEQVVVASKHQTKSGLNPQYHQH